MSNAFAVDAHALVWYLEGNPRLGGAARAALSDPSSVLYLPIIALAPDYCTCWVVGKGKSAIPSVENLLTDVDADPRIHLVPLDRATLDLSLTFTIIDEMHDRQIAAAALLVSASLGQTVALLTRDENVTASGLVPVVW